MGPTAVEYQGAVTVAVPGRRSSAFVTTVHSPPLSFAWPNAGFDEVPGCAMEVIVDREVRLTTAVLLRNARNTVNTTTILT